MTDLLSSDFRPRFTDSVSRLTSLSRLCVSRALREGGSDQSRLVDALSRAMFRKASSPALPLADRLRLLASLHGLLNGTTYIVDRRREERWDTLAGEVVEAAFPRALAGEGWTGLAKACPRPVNGRASPWRMRCGGLD